MLCDPAGIGYLRPRESSRRPSQVGEWFESTAELWFGLLPTNHQPGTTSGVRNTLMEALWFSIQSPLRGGGTWARGGHGDPQEENAISRLIS
jgi:hypothetical protein